MNLRDVITSSGNINASFPDFIREKTGLTKLLGVRYNTDSDEFLLGVSPEFKQKLSKQQLVSEVNKIYDPLGLSLPVLLKAKLLMREVVTQKVPWNEPLDKKYVSRWNEICAEIRRTAIKIPHNIATANHLHKD